LVTLEGLSSTFTLVTEIAVMAAAGTRPLVQSAAAGT
jgi:hypothetical protein